MRRNLGSTAGRSGASVSARSMRLATLTITIAVTKEGDAERTCSARSIQAVHMNGA
jgi:hypothetical protein